MREAGLFARVGLKLTKHCKESFKQNGLERISIKPKKIQIILYKIIGHG